MLFRSIYAHTTADGRYSLSSRDIDFDDDIQGVNTGVFLYPVMDQQEMMHMPVALECMLLGFFFLLLKLPFFIVIDLVILSNYLLLLLFYSREYA